MAVLLEGEPSPAALTEFRDLLATGRRQPVTTVRSTGRGPAPHAGRRPDDPVHPLRRRPRGQRRHLHWRVRRSGGHRRLRVLLVERCQGGTAPGHLLRDEEPRRSRGEDRTRRVHQGAARSIAGHAHSPRRSQLRRTRRVVRAGRRPRRPTTDQVHHPPAGRLLALRVRRPAALRRQPQGRPGRDPRPDRRADGRRLLSPRRRGRHVLPSCVDHLRSGRGRDRRIASTAGAVWVTTARRG